MKTKTLQQSAEIENYGEPIGIRLHPSVLSDLDAIKRRRHASRNQLIRLAVDALIEHEKLTGNIISVEEMQRLLRRWKEMS